MKLKKGAKSISAIMEYGMLSFQFKWNPQKNVRLSKTFSNAYSNHEFKVITPENFHEFAMSF
jgi:hypothetical protein